MAPGALSHPFFCRLAEVVAPEPICCLLVKRQPSGELLWGVIGEREAYSQESHHTRLPLLYAHGPCRARSWPPLLFAGTYKRWANLLVWGSVAASTYIVMIAAGGGLMFRSLGDYDDKQPFS